MNHGITKILVSLFMAALFLGCTKPAREATVLKHYPINDMDGLITLSGVEFDTTISSDGKGSLKIVSTEPKTVKLFETGDIDVENALITYRAKIRTEDVKGKVYIEMFCSFTGKGEFFSRALQSPLSGTMEWSTQETPFFLKKGENPDNIKLNAVIDGTGTVWIDDVHLFKAPLK